MNKKIRIYLIARISEDAHAWNKRICDRLKPPITVFLPQEHNPWNKRHDEFGINVYETDLQAMKKSHIGLLLPEFGKDSAFEVGWYTNTRKPVIVFVDTQKEWLSDWMVKGGVNIIVTKNPSTYSALKGDPILKHKKIKLIKRLDELNRIIKSVYNDVYAKKLPAKS